MRGADKLAQALQIAGVQKVFSLSGNQIMSIFDSCLDTDIRLFHVRHEGAAVFMAEAWAQLSGQIGVAMVTAGPGLGNALGALYAAKASESPVLLLSGDAPQAQEGLGSFQALDLVSMTKPLTKLSFRASDPARLDRDLAMAIQTALSDRPGPVHLSLPADVLAADSGKASLVSVADFSPVTPDQPDVGTLVKMRQLLDQAARPLVLAGPALRAHQAFLSTLSDRLDAPVIPIESPRGIKDPALGNISTAFAEADRILCLGKAVDFSIAFGKAGVWSPESQWMVIDADDRQLEQAKRNLGERLILSLKAHPFAAGDSLSQMKGAGSSREGWRDHVSTQIVWRGYDLARIANTHSTADAHPARSQSAGVHPAALCAQIGEFLARDPASILICDGGEFGQWAQAVLQSKRRVICGSGGVIGCALPYGMAARAHDKTAPVFALSGDGSAGFHLSEFETAVREDLPLILIIGNDRCWNAENQLQLREYGAKRLTGCDLSAARYDLAAAALGAHGEYVTDLGDFDAALTRAIESGKPACIDVAIEGIAAPGPGTPPA